MDIPKNSHSEGKYCSKTQNQDMGLVVFFFLSVDSWAHKLSLVQGQIA